MGAPHCRGRLDRHAVFYQAPLYPYFLGTIYAIAGRSLLLIRVCQAVLGSISCVLLGLAGRRLFSPKVGLIAGLGLALYAPRDLFRRLLQKSALDEFFMCLMVWLSARVIDDPRRPTSWLWLGLATGGLSLTRVECARLRGRDCDLGARATVEPEEDRVLCRRTRGRSASVAIRNSVVSGGFYLTTSQFGPNFYMGNNEHADGTAMSLRAGRGSPEYERQDAIDIAEQARGRALTPGEVVELLDRTWRWRLPPRTREHG